MKTQTKESAEKLAMSTLSKFNKLSVKMSIDRWAIAKYMFILRDTIAWAITKYGTFKTFHHENVNIAYGTCSQYITAHINLRRLGYTPKELKELCVIFKFTQLTLIFKNLPEYVKVTELIKKYNVPRKYAGQQGFKLPKPSKISTSQSNLFRFVLRPKYAKKFHALLQEHGAHRRGVDGRLLNSSHAMETYLDTL